MNHPIERDRLDLQFALLEQRPHAINHRYRPLVVLLDVLHNGFQLIPIRGLLLEKQFGRLGIPKNGTQRLIQLMCQRR